MRGRIRGRLGGLAAALACLPALACPASAQTAPTFPAGADRADLVTWLRQETDITPAQVVAVSPSAVTAVLGTIETADPRVKKVALRAEAIDAGVSAREGVLSWHMLMEVDCVGHKLRQGPTTGYEGRNLLGEGRQIRPASEAWSEPPPGAQLESVWRAACEPDFQRPLAAPRVASATQAGKPALALRPMLIQDTRDAPPVAKPAPAPPAKPRPTPQPAPPPVRAMIAIEPRQAAAIVSTAAVQLGAMATRAAAEALLANLRTNFEGALHGLTPTIAPANVGGRTVYRAMVTGFTRRADANQFCAGLTASHVACFVR